MFVGNCCFFCGVYDRYYNGVVEDSADIAATFAASVLEVIISKTSSQAVVATFITYISEAMSLEDAQTVNAAYNNDVTENISIQDTSSGPVIFAVSNIENITVADLLLVAAWIRINTDETTDWVLIDNRQ